jgi:hypothetical protein
LFLSSKAPGEKNLPIHYPHNVSDESAQRV